MSWVRQASVAARPGFRHRWPERLQRSEKKDLQAPSAVSAGRSSSMGQDVRSSPRQIVRVPWGSTSARRATASTTDCRRASALPSALPITSSVARLGGTRNEANSCLCNSRDVPSALPIATRFASPGVAHHKPTRPALRLGEVPAGAVGAARSWSPRSPAGLFGVSTGSQCDGAAQRRGKGTRTQTLSVQGCMRLRRSRWVLLGGGSLAAASRARPQRRGNGT